MAVFSDKNFFSYLGIVWKNLMGAVGWLRVEFADVGLEVGLERVPDRSVVEVE